jgi:hypothetical protein
MNHFDEKDSGESSSTSKIAKHTTMAGTAEVCVVLNFAICLFVPLFVVLKTTVCLVLSQFPALSLHFMIDNE